MGDNVAFNAALARNLGLPQAKCIAHALNLIVKHFFDELPLLKPLTLLAGSILTAGGSAKLKHAWTAAGLNFSKSITFPNRFGTTVINAVYRANNFTAVKRFLLQLVPDLFEGGDQVDEEDLDAALENMEAEIVGADTVASRTEKVAQAYKRFEASATLQVVRLLLSEITSLIERSSGNETQMDLSFFASLERLRESLEDVANHASSAELVFLFCFLKFLFIYLFIKSFNFFFAQVVKDAFQAARTEAQTAAAQQQDPFVPAAHAVPGVLDGYIRQLTGLVQKAAKAGLKSFTKHIDPQLELLKITSRFNVNEVPATDGYDVASFFGEPATRFVFGSYVPCLKLKKLVLL
jgi:hypothetical protein